MNRKYESLHIIYCLKVGVYLKKIYCKEAKKITKKRHAIPKRNNMPPFLFLPN